MNLINLKVLFIGDGSIWSQFASEFVQKHFKKVSVILWDHGNGPRPRKHLFWMGDWIFSFKSDLILPDKVLKCAKSGAINFHPAPPRYRGIGGYYHALDNGDKRYGVTCHHMVEKVDYGKIIRVEYFPILDSEKPLSLKTRTGAYCLTLFYEIVISIVLGHPLPKSDINWEKRLYTYKDLQRFKE